MEDYKFFSIFLYERKTYHSSFVFWKSLFATKPPALGLIYFHFSCPLLQVGIISADRILVTFMAYIFSLPLQASIQVISN
jgi:hypothetical protein